MDEARGLERLEPVSYEDPPPFLERHFDDLSAEPADALELHRRGIVGNHDRAAHVAAPRAPGEALRHVPSARRVDAVRQICIRQQRKGVVCPAHLEGPHRLQALELQQELGTTVGFEADHRRPRHHPGKPLARGLDVCERDRVGLSRLNHRQLP